MIVVVEGVSASGKSTWCARHAGGRVVAETGRLEDVPNPSNDPEGSAWFWAERNAARWQAALAFEQAVGVAVCDTDPLKLHYVWCLWQIGEAEERDWRLQLEATRETITDERLGFADRYLVQGIDPVVARQRAASDPSRRRRNFDVHVRLQPPLLAWYGALAAVMPERVAFGWPDALPPVVALPGRYDLAAFDRMIDTLSSGC